MQIDNSFIGLLILSDTLFFLIGFIIGFLLAHRLNKEKKKINLDGGLKFLVTLAVTVAWFSSMVMELVDRTYIPNILLHVIFGMVAGGTLDINFGDILRNSGRIKKDTKNNEV